VLGSKEILALGAKFVDNKPRHTKCQGRFLFALASGARMLLDSKHAGRNSRAPLLFLL
jgi:hypothetical protein